MSGDQQPFAALGAEIDENHDAYEALSSQSRALLEEALDLVNDQNSGAQGVQRVVQIFTATSNEVLDVNILFPQEYGETLLIKAIDHSLAMVQALLDVGADPTVGDMMMGETALDKLLEIDEQYRTTDQTEMIRRFQGLGLEKSPSAEDALEEHRKNLYWAIGVDPDELDAAPAGIIKTLFEEQLGPKLKWAASLEPETLAWRVEYQKKVLANQKRWDTELNEESQTLLKEAFRLVTIDPDTDMGTYGDDPAAAVKRVKQILSMKEIKSIGPNLLSYDHGEPLLHLVVCHYCLEEEEGGYQLDLVKFLLEAGADPNLENAMDRESALDHLDYNVEFDKLTNEQKEIIRLLKEAGAKILPRDDMGKVIGERGSGEGYHEKARREAEEESEAKKLRTAE